MVLTIIGGILLFGYGCFNVVSKAGSFHNALPSFYVGAGIVLIFTAIIGLGWGRKDSAAYINQSRSAFSNTRSYFLLSVGIGTILSQLTNHVTQINFVMGILTSMFFLTSWLTLFMVLKGRSPLVSNYNSSKYAKK